MQQVEMEFELEPEIKRPVTRADCKNVPRPCPFVSCKYNLYLDVSKKTGNITYNYTDDNGNPTPVDEIGCNNCALDHADKGGMSEIDIVTELHVVRQTINNMINRTLPKLVKLKVFGYPEGRRGSNLAQSQDDAFGDGGAGK